MSELKKTDSGFNQAIPLLTIADTSYPNRIRIQSLLESHRDQENRIGQIIKVCGWCKTIRKQGGGDFCFVSLNDGSTCKNLQIIVDKSIEGYDQLLKCSVGSSFQFIGEVTKSPAVGQSIELQVSNNTKHSFILYGMANAKTYPLSKKHHSREFMRGMGHLRPRSFLISAVARIRSQLCMATHRYFQDKGFTYVHTPIITASDCEGAGDLFEVSTLIHGKLSDLQHANDISKIKNIDFKDDFFNKATYLTVSGQLAVENYCCAMSDVYAFGPTFRAENSHTSRHLAEFWMVEPELAFADIYDNMQCAEDYLKYCIEWCMRNCISDIEWFDKNVENNLIQRLQNTLHENFVRITYTEAIDILKKSSEYNSFKQKVEWGDDLSSEHEKYITDQVYKKPVIVYNYPRTLKAFYMRLNDDNQTVAAMDVLLPKIGEVIGGSQREERLSYLDKSIQSKNIDPQSLWWYRELREYGSITHSGFGLGLERLIMAITGVENIRDTIPFPRYPGHADF